MKGGRLMKKETIKTNEELKKVEEKFEIEGYGQCATTAHKCLHDCMGSKVFWTSNN